MPSDTYDEDEYIVDRRRLKEVEVLERYSHLAPKQYSPKNQI